MHSRSPGTSRSPRSSRPITETPQMMPASYLLVQVEVPLHIGVIICGLLMLYRLSYLAAVGMMRLRRERSAGVCLMPRLVLVRMSVRGFVERRSVKIN